MIFTETELKGAYLVDLERKADSRGFFARAFCAREFAEHGLKTSFVQCNLSFNHLRGTLRGLHYQCAPAAESKLIRCLRGAVYYALVDLRPSSPTYTSHISVELSAENRTALYVPEMFAIGYQALADNTELIYQHSEFYTPECERGLRYDDPFFGIEWPLPVTVISEKDAALPLFESAPVRVSGGTQ
ncbi:MAG TPA: dTDP-4-dehydrorhamnose 3,5-epimerase [Pyrinomonadaceae bacterium]|nr:dTDP-4-dehydrorhamnose 3,5-epimerase [Pyrinomonadaceae bacterium]